MLNLAMLLLLFLILILFLGGFLFIVIWLALPLLFPDSKKKKPHQDVINRNSIGNKNLNKGIHGEYLTLQILERLMGNNKILMNVYIPKADGSTTEIDLLMINKTGIYVFESKNYSGWIFGNEKNRNWTTSLRGGTKIQFLSPVVQNNGHIRALRNVLGETRNIYYSYIVFSERCELKRVSVTVPDIFVLKRNMLFSALQKDMSNRPEILTDTQIAAFYEALQKYSLADTETKEKHIQSIVNRQLKEAYVTANPIVATKSVMCLPAQGCDRVLAEEVSTSAMRPNPEDTPIYIVLKKYRCYISKEEDVKAYSVYNNAQILDIISAMPASLEDLKKIPGFGNAKCQKYGHMILEIVRLHR